MLNEISNASVKWDESQKIYYFSFYYKGERYYRNSTKWVKGKKYLATDALNKLVNELTGEQPISNISFDELVEEYLDFESTYRRPNTMNTKQRVITNHILPDFTDEIANDITIGQLTRFTKSLLDKKYKQKGKEHFYSNDFLGQIQTELRSIFEFGYRHEYLDQNLTQRLAPVKHNTVQRKKRFRKVPQEDFDKVIDNTEDVYTRALLLISRYHGFRPGEITGLDIGDVDFANRTLSVHQSWDSKTQTLSPPKNNKERITAMPEQVVDVLEEIMEIYDQYDYDDNTPLLHATERIPKSTMDRWKNDAIERAGVRSFSWYDLRHSHATELLEMGFDVWDIAERMGHSETETLNTYVIVDLDKQHDMARRLEKL